MIEDVAYHEDHCVNYDQPIWFHVIIASSGMSGS